MIQALKFWTIQKKIHVSQAMEEGVYVPEFRLSDTLLRDIRQKLLFEFFLHSFNTVNNCSFPGLVSTFHWAQGSKFGPIHDFESFISLMRQRADVVKGLWSHLDRPENVVVELEVNEPFLNPLFIDFNDFSFLMEPRIVMPPYTEGEDRHLLDLVSKGKMQISPLPSSIIQGHLPFIRKDQIVGTFPLFGV